MAEHNSIQRKTYKWNIVLKLKVPSRTQKCDSLKPRVGCFAEVAIILIVHVFSG